MRKGLWPQCLAFHLGFPEFQRHQETHLGPGVLTSTLKSLHHHLSFTTYIQFHVQITIKQPLKKSVLLEICSYMLFILEGEFLNV